MYTVSLPGSCVIETGVCSMRPYFITARKQSLRRLCFTRVCHSVHGGGVSQHALQVSRPTPKGELEGSGRGDLQAHTQGGGVSQHALRLTATATGGTHPNGMYSC